MISVCIATYNGDKFIKEQINSILIQLNHDDEIIISDDSSTDDTIKIIKSFNDKRIRIIESQKFKNPIFNFENAINNSLGDFIFLSDQDDFWMPNKVEVMLEKLKSFDLVVSDCFIGDENLQIIRDSHFAWRNSKQGFLKNFLQNSYLGCCMAFKSKILKKIIPFPKNIPMHDIWIGLISEIFYKSIFIPEKLIIYRRHNSNATSLTSNFKSKSSLLKKISFRLMLINPIFLRVFKIK